MKMSNVFGHRNVKHLIFGVLMLMPLIAIFSRVAYVVVNKNAYQSYSDSNVKNVSQVTSNDFLVEKANLTINSSIISSTNIVTPIFNYSWVSVNWVDLIGAPSNYTYNGFAIRTGTETNNKFIYLYENGVQVYEKHQSNINWLNNNLPISFTLISYSGGSTNWFNYINTSYLSIEKQSLDNVFEYSVSKFVEDDNGKLDFVNWFSDLFVDFDNSNSVYFHFINWYLNYALLVSCAYLLFYVLFWFIDFIKNCMDSIGRRIN